LEDAADRTAVEHPVPDIPEEEREMPGPAAGDDADLLFFAVPFDIAPQVPIEAFDRIVVGCDDALHHLVDVGLGGVNELFHAQPPFWR
jgi:predicted dinucleotide-binding enzyme